jgi:hypothetical protein
VHRRGATRRLLCHGQRPTRAPQCEGLDRYANELRRDLRTRTVCNRHRIFAPARLARAGERAANRGSQERAERQGGCVCRNASGTTAARGRAYRRGERTSARCPRVLRGRRLRLRPHEVRASLRALPRAPAARQHRVLLRKAAKVRRRARVHAPIQAGGHGRRHALFHRFERLRSDASLSTSIRPARWSSSTVATSDPRRSPANSCSTTGRTTYT